jgi:Protein of unknown function (DUF1353)
MGWTDQRVYKIPRQKGGVQLFEAISPATVTRFGGDAMWFWLHDAIGWQPNVGGQGELAPVSVPAGFVTDLTSVPWYLWSWLPNDGPYMHAAIIHDWLYWNQRGTRGDADDILNNDMTDLKVGFLTRQTIYRTVQLRGGSSWDANAKLKAAGEKRLLKKFPTDPVTTWDEWKTKPDVFA